MLSAKQHDDILKTLESTLNSVFKKENVKKLADYMGGELGINPPKNEQEYQEKIKNPMQKIFGQIKRRIIKKLGREINNEPYEPINDNLFMVVALYGRYGNCYFMSFEPNTGGPIANSYENGPLKNNTISGNRNSDGSYCLFNANTLPSQMAVILNTDPKYVSSSVGFFAPAKRVGHRACRKLINDYTGIVGGVMAVALYNV